ncbi:tetratricopeptide repeat protein [Candidatus Woesearchaeota archaeon]|nr:tetratricopeptide repeat protein [Candidatus Woesearchaeota archaeon]
MSDKNLSFKVDNPLLEYIKKELKSGSSKELIRYDLLKRGYNPNHLEFHFQLVHRRDKQKKIFAMMLIAMVLAFSLILFFKKFLADRDYHAIIEEGIALCREGEYEKSIEKFDEAIKLNISASRGYGRKGLCLLKQGNYSDAITWLKKSEYAGTGYPQGNINPNYFNNLGKAYCGAGNYGMAVAQFEKAIGLNSSNLNYHKSVGECYLKKGEMEKAGFYLNLSNKPNNLQ